MPDLQKNLTLLFAPDGAENQDNIYCVQVIATNLNKILEDFEKKTSKMHSEIQRRKDTLQLALDNPTRLVPGFDYDKSPRHILPLILELDSAQQKLIFEKSRCNNALEYALLFEQEALIEFDLDSSTKKAAIQHQDIERNDALVIAAKNGGISIARLLIDWGAEINSYTAGQLWPLHAAVIN